MKKQVALMVVFFFLCGAADVHAAIQWFAGNGTAGGATAETNFGTALSPLVVDIQNFEGFSSGSTVDTIPLAGMNVDVNAISADGSATENSPRIFAGSFGSQPAGTINGKTLLSGNASEKAQIEFIFPQPVVGFGVWVFDNANGIANEFELEFFDGSIWHTSPSRIDAAPNSTAHVVDGFLGVVSDSGIQKARVLNYSGSGGSSLINTAFELDHAQAAQQVIPEPAALVIWSLLGALGMTVGWSRRRSRET